MTGRGEAAPKLSLCVITFNESKNIDACLASALSLVDEIVVLDSGSTDDTVARANAHGARVHVEPFRGFGPQKNRAFELARGEWILSLDADERVTPELARELATALSRPGETSAFSFPRENFVGARPMRRGGPFHNWPDRVVRLFRRGKARCRDRAVHEEMLVDGRVARLHAPLRHEAYDSHATMLKAMDRYATLGALRAFREGRGTTWRASTTHACLRGAFTFFHKWVLRGGIIDGGHGFAGSVAAATYTFLKYAKLAELAARVRAGEDIDAISKRILAPPGATS